MDTFTGYMLQATLEGDVLTLHGTNRASRVALAGQDHGTDPVVPLAEVAHTDWKPASRLTNGRLILFTRAGQSYTLHFRRKQQADMERLAAALA